MRAKQSSTATRMYSRATERISRPGDLGPSEFDRSGSRAVSGMACERKAGFDVNSYRQGGGDTAFEKFPGDGLLHDARNLVSAIGLYCDLLSMPGVLRPEHRKYSDELRLLGTRSQEMIEHLMDSLATRTTSSVQDAGTVRQRVDVKYGERRRGARQLGYRAEAVSLRSIVERCSGLLSRVANGRAIDANYGPAANMPVRIAEESVERILVNLVRNASAALGEERAAIRISVGSRAGSRRGTGLAI